MIMYEGKFWGGGCERQLYGGNNRLPHSEIQCREGERESVCVYSGWVAVWFQPWWVCCWALHGWVELQCNSLRLSKKPSPTERSPNCHMPLNHGKQHTHIHTHTHKCTAEPFSLTEPLAHSAQLVPESTLELHIWCQCSVRGRPSAWMETEGGWGETGNSGGHQKIFGETRGGGWGGSHQYCLINVYAPIKNGSVCQMRRILCEH